jgi:ribonuclease BN (tRNA processing enzyme)
VTDTSSPSGLSRRSLLAGLAAAPIITALAEQGVAQTAGPSWTPQQAQAALKDAKGTKLVVLGTAADPVPGRSRMMTSHVMLSNGAAYVLDCGMGVTDQYARTGIPFNALKSIFITHHHADHNIEYGPLLIVGWIQGLPLDIRAFGPPPLRQVTDDFMRAYKQTVDFWAEDFHVFRRHRAARGGRQDGEGRRRAGARDDVCAGGGEIHQSPDREGPAGQVRGIHGAHERRPHTGRRRGRIAVEAGVKTLVLSHLTPAIDSITDDTWRAPAAKYFKGEIIVGKDLMVV